MGGPGGGRVAGGGSDIGRAPQEFYYSDHRSRAQDLTSISAVTYYARWLLELVNARYARIPVYANADGQVGAALALYRGPGLAKVAGGSQQVAASLGDVKLLEIDFGAERIFDGEYLLAWRALNAQTFLQYFGIFKNILGPITKAAHGLGYINTGYGLSLPDTAPTWATMLSPTAGFIPFFALTRRDSSQD